MKLMYVLILTVTMVGCVKANFGGKAGQRGSQAIEAGDTKPIDMSDGELNGPTAGQGEQLGKTIEVDCEDSQGIIVDIGDVNPEHPIDGDEVGSEDFYLQSPAGDKIVLDKDGNNTQGDETPFVKGSKNPKGKDIITPTESNVSARVRGRFCPQSNKQLTVLFVVDLSGSMGAHVPTQGQFKGQEHPGYDPQINGTCGRLEAARAIMDRIATQMRPEDDVRIGMVPFASGILGDRYIDVTEFAAFGSMMNKDSFCQHVVQAPRYGYDPQNPGGIDGSYSGVAPSTNYRAAFRGAQSVLQNVYGRKVVYFISDGQPTSGGFDPIQAGIDAGNRMRDSIDNLSMNGLLLGNAGPQAREVLELVAGSPNRVRNAEQADQLADQILNFPDATINPDTARAILSLQAYGSTDVGFAYFRPAQGMPNVWEYETAPFTLLGIPGMATVNLLEILAEGSDGSTHSAVFRIRFHR
jgi:hypothetical protein